MGPLGLGSDETKYLSNSVLRLADFLNTSIRAMVLVGAVMEKPIVKVIQFFILFS
jgi:hypothetical protein